MGLATTTPDTIPPGSLLSRIPATPTRDADDILERFLAWMNEIGLDPYPAQEEALLEWMSGRHVILNTPTGSGKSLVALAVHFKALCERKRSFYTSPIKALVNEKFFDLCRTLGARNVGMLTGDASINASAPVVCCTAEVLANIALRDGESAEADSVVMDEFHFFSDPDRGMAWQVPLLTLRRATFLLMSATLGDTSPFSEQIEGFTGREVSLVTSTERPVPLSYRYQETPIFETLQDLIGLELAPIYVVNFTQREAAELAQGLTSLGLCSREERRTIGEDIGTTRFDTHYGKDIKRLVQHGVGLHHAGLLPKYRSLVERLAQRGRLKVISGTDTLGVGVNVPIRTVLFTKLCKYDGDRVRILTVRDFRQISGRAGRKGFDDAGSVVVQAPEHVIENRRLEVKAAGDPKKKRKLVKKKPPDRGYVHWDRTTFDTLVESRPEPLESQFEVSHGVVLTMMRREIDPDRPDGGYRRLVELIARSYDRPGAMRRHRRRAAELFRDLRNASIIEVVPGVSARGSAAARVSTELQRDFSLMHTLSLYMLEAIGRLDGQAPEYPLDLLSLVEAVVEHPHVILRAQVSKLKSEMVARLKADGADYHERLEAIERIDHDKPCADFLYATFDAFRAKHPWVRAENVRPKSIARDLYERYASFNDYVRIYGLGRSEGVLLRYLTQVYKTLVQSVPDVYKTEAVDEMVAYLRVTLSRVDASLLHEWESLAEGGEATDEPRPTGPRRPSRSELERSFRLRMHALVGALARFDYEEALRSLYDDGDDPWTESRLEAELRPFVEEYGTPRFSHEARFPALTCIEPKGDASWQVRQTLVGEDGPTEWMIEVEIHIEDFARWDEPSVRLQRIAV